MDIDGYIARNEPSWRRLAELTRRARQRVANLAPAELDELIQLYQRTSAQLSYARTYFHDTTLTNRLTRLVADASRACWSWVSQTPIRIAGTKNSAAAMRMNRRAFHTAAGYDTAKKVRIGRDVRARLP